MEIRTERLLLRPVEAADLSAVHAYASDIENTKFMMYLPYESIVETEQAIQKAVDQWTSPTPAYWEFAATKNSEVIGGVTLYFVSEGEFELGWVLSKYHWHKGYAVEAAQGVVDYARRHLNAKRIFAGCDKENTASENVMRRLNMHLCNAEGKRTNRSMGSEERTELVYEILF
jgi:RimJ/RimL family protein N-acetyltransferase